MKRFILPLAAALAFALAAAAGGALAKDNPAHGHPAKGRGHRGSHASRTKSLIPSLAPHPRLWLKALRPALRPSAHTRKAPRHAKPAGHSKVAHRQAPERQPRQSHPLRGTTLSIYEQTTKPRFLRAQGCSAARRHESGVAVLDFGKPSYKHDSYGTILFSDRFAPNRRITAAMVTYAQGYVRCLPKGSRASIVLARGTSNYHPVVPSAYAAGVRWARATNRLGRILRRKGLAEHVEAAAADDAEPAWDRYFRLTREFVHGFRVAVHGHNLYDYGSLDGGVGVIWSAKQAWYVAGGIRHTKALPEIYNSGMAREWAELARIAHRRYPRDVDFAGVMTQGTPSCNCGLRPDAAHRVLAQALDLQGVGQIAVPSGGTNIVG